MFCKICFICSLVMVKGVLPKYFSSIWSFTKFQVPGNLHCICVFGLNDNTVIGECGLHHSIDTHNDGHYKYVMVAT